LPFSPFSRIIYAHYTERVLFEFKYDRKFKNPENVARVLAQTMYYARLLKFGAGLTRYPLPPVICVVDKNEAFFAETKDYARFYAAKGDRYDWDRAPSTPCPKLVEDVLRFLISHKEHKEHKDFANSAFFAAEKTDAATGLPSEFVADCVVWAAFSNKNNCAALKDVEYQGDVWQIPNQMYPFLLEEVRQWTCAHGDIAAQIATANEDRFLAKWLAVKTLSPEARAVLDAARRLYRDFYANLTHTPWMDWKIETWDAGFYQIRNAMKCVATTPSSSHDGEAPSLHSAHDTLRAKLLPQIYALGFLNPDVEYFE
jgi:hypothetical protein